MKKSLCFCSFALGSAHEKSDVWPRPNFPNGDTREVKIHRFRPIRVPGSVILSSGFHRLRLFSRYHFVDSFSVDHSLSRETENLRENIPTPEKFSIESNAIRIRKSEPVYLNLAIDAKWKRKTNKHTGFFISWIVALFSVTHAVIHFI